MCVRRCKGSHFSAHGQPFCVYNHHFNVSSVDKTPPCIRVFSLLLLLSREGAKARECPCAGRLAAHGRLTVADVGTAECDRKLPRSFMDASGRFLTFPDVLCRLSRLIVFWSFDFWGLTLV